VSNLEWWKGAGGAWFYGYSGQHPGSDVVVASVRITNGTGMLFSYQIYLTTGLQEARYKTLEAAKLAVELIT